MINGVPLTAWEQGGMVVLFALLFGSIITLLLRWFTGQQREWQVFIEGRDKNWQGFLKEQRQSDKDQRDEDNLIVRELVDQVKALTAELVGLRQNFESHDRWEHEKFDEITKKPPTRGRG